MRSVSINKKDLIPALIGAGICLFFQRNNFLTLFFLVPLGFLAFRYGYRAAWTAFLVVVVGSIVPAGGPALAALTKGQPIPEIMWDILYFTVMASIFLWITAAPPGFSERVSGVLRFIIGSCLGTLLFTGVFFRAVNSPVFSDYIASSMNSLVSFYQSSGIDVVQSALLESLTPEIVLESIKAVMLRGGSMVSCVLLFFLSRQVSLALARLARREKGTVPLMSFHVYPAMIWVLSVSLLLVVLTGITELEIPQIILWNVLVLCGILYFAQGMGILQFFLTRPSTAPFLRLFFCAVFIVLLFSPGINAVLLGGVVLLGIAENWIPFRVFGQNGPPSTPKAGDGGD